MSGPGGLRLIRLVKVGRGWSANSGPGEGGFCGCQMGLNSDRLGREDSLVNGVDGAPSSISTRGSVLSGAAAESRGRSLEILSRPCAKAWGLPDSDEW